MKTKNKFLQIATVMTILLVTYTAITLFDQFFQTVVITNPEKLLTNKPALSNTNPDYQRLKQLGFSDLILSHMSKREIDLYNNFTGKVVDERNMYWRINGSNEAPISKNEYNQLLRGFAGSKMPRLTTLERADLKLAYMGNRKYILITEHHIDYGPRGLQPLGVELELADSYLTDTQTAKQIWWTASNFNPRQLKSGTILEQPSNTKPDSGEMIFFFGDRSQQHIYYSVNWKQGFLMDDVIGLHFYTITSFEVPEDRVIVDAFVQGQNPFLSQQLQYEVVPLE